MLKRNLKVTVRLDEDEYSHLKTQLRRTGYSQEAYLRMLISGRVPREMPPVEYHSLIRELNAIGNNLNQIARAANMSGVVDGRYHKEADALAAATLAIQRAVTAPDKF